jgi:hypothetical protein
MLALLGSLRSKVGSTESLPTSGSWGGERDDAMD